MKKKLVLGGVITAAWLAALALGKALVAPAIGAATVMQFEASDPAYVASMFFATVLGIGTLLISVLFAYALYVVASAKE